MILLNTLVLCMEVSNASDGYKKALWYCNTIFVFVFLLEAIVKITAYGPLFYFKVPTNQFDFVIVVLSLLGLPEDLIDVNFTAFRIVRVARLLRILNASKELQMLLKTLYMAMNNILNVCLLFALIIFTFTVAGMDLFGEITLGPEQFINHDANFRTFYTGFMLLVRTSTGESWNGVMHDTA